MDAPPAAVCRVCLAGDLNTYSVANTALEQTYDVVTGVKMQRAGRPTALCCVCVSQLRRCRRFIQTARESNDALDRWYQNHTHTDSKLTARPLFSLTKISPELMDIWEPQVKQKPTETEDADQDDGGTFITDEIKHEVLSDPTHVSQTTEDSTQISDDKQDQKQELDDDGSDYTESCGVKSKISKISDNIEWVNVQDYLNADDDQTHVSNDVTLDIQEVVDDVGSETAPGTSNVGRKRASLDQDIPTRSLRSGKRIKLMTDGPGLEQRRPITARHRPSNTDTTSTPRYQRHMFSCSQCTYTTATKWNFKQHLMTHTEAKPFMCDMCDYKCKWKISLKEHLMTHTGAKPFMCDKCDYKCKRMGLLKQHLMTHTGAKPFMCDKCDYKCRQKGKLKQHLMTHTGAKPFMCDKCDYKCKWKGSLKLHLMTHTGAKPFMCDKCDYKCKWKSSLKLHLMTHTGAKPFMCDKCDYKCRHKGSLKEHLMIHTGAKPFMCDMCDYKCRQKVSLKEHLMTHTGAKPFMCDKCDYKCRQKGKLKQHLMTHTGAKPFMCDKCDYKCRQKGKLKQHLMTHTGAKPFMCDKCDYKCNRNSNLKKHLMTHTGAKPFMCDMCDYKCRRKGNLKRHLKTHTGDGDGDVVKGNCLNFKRFIATGKIKSRYHYVLLI